MIDSKELEEEKREGDTPLTSTFKAIKAPAPCESDFKYQNLLKKRVSRLEVFHTCSKEHSKIVVLKFDLTGYLIHNLTRLIESLFNSVHLIPLSIRLYLKLLYDHLEEQDVSEQKRIQALIEYLVKGWLCPNILNPSYFGMQMKPMSFKEDFQKIFFHTLHDVFYHTMMMDVISELYQHNEYFDVVRINEFIII
eukprot:CAMPEP_0170554120 /NCGR_PEP_ID=MMETSP0211-20121228/12002_1 /TAXON_ID=311385 /ORGANISM="Pseudokeronopsis sp., Strain OXSARD2" /LENGTH=193 /DNA_ID=CAMNT_0010862985 /DNA_START=746 /DNA_END=1327 /DNA_ORIENTATION=+